MTTFQVGDRVSFCGVMGLVIENRWDGKNIYVEFECPNVELRDKLVFYPSGQLFENVAYPSLVLVEKRTTPYRKKWLNNYGMGAVLLDKKLDVQDILYVDSRPVRELLDAMNGALVPVDGDPKKARVLKALIEVEALLKDET